MAGKDVLLQDLVSPVATALGYDLWGIEYLAHSKQTLVRIYIDGPDGVNVDDCAKLSRQVSSVFDVEDPIMGEYNLEVSSPGMDRPLFTLDQFRLYIGEDVKVKLSSPFDGRRNFVGKMTAIEGDDVVVAVDDEEYLLPYDLIDKANIVPRF